MQNIIRIALPAAILLASSTADAQTKRNLQFLSPPERMVVSQPEADPSPEGPCTIVVDLSIDRDGRVIKAQAIAPLSNCADLAAMVNAAKIARAYSFEPSTAAPMEHKARITWTVGYLDPDVVAVPEHEDQGVEESSASAHDAVELPPPPDPSAPEVYQIAAVEEMPEFPGGQSVMYTYFAKYVKYPADAFEAGVQGKVFVEFVVQSDGSITNVVLRRGVHASLDAEAIRVVKSMPKWKPGKLNGKPVATRFTMPIVFKMD